MKKAQKMPSKRTGKTITKKATKKVAKKAPKRAVKKATKRTAKRVSKRISKRVSKKVPRKRHVRRPLSRRHSIFETEMPDAHRLQKFLAVSGFGSRRQCEELIEQGRVEIDGVVATLGARIDPTRSEIKVDGQKIKRVKPVYIALFKPKGFLCTDRDQQGRQRAIDLVPDTFGRLFLVGRLDQDSEGLILLTNDGTLSERLTHPKYGVPKVYRVQAAGEVAPETVAKLKAGEYFAEGFAKVANAVIKGQYKQTTVLDITLTEGMNREVRRLLARMGHKVMSLIRTAVGPVKLGKLAPGEWRLLTQQEVDRLYAAQ